MAQYLANFLYFFLSLQVAVSLSSHSEKSLNYYSIVLVETIQSKPWKMFAATLQPSWPSRPKTNVTLLFYFLKLYNFGVNGIFVGLTSSELQHPWISKIMTEPKKLEKKYFFGLNLEVLLINANCNEISHSHCNLLEFKVVNS